MTVSDREERRARIAAARKRREALGLTWGRPRAIDAAMLARAREMRANGCRLRENAAVLRLKLTTLHRALHAPVEPSQ